MLQCICKSEGIKVNNDTYSPPLWGFCQIHCLIMLILQNDTKLTRLSLPQRIFWSKFSCTILPFNHTHQFQSQLDLAVPISSTSSLCQMRESLLGTFQKSSRVREGWVFFPGWVLGICPGHLGLRRMKRKQTRTVCENRNLHFSFRRMALLLAWVCHGQIVPCFPELLLKHIFPHFSLVLEQCGRHGSYFTVNLNRCSWIQNSIFWAFRECWLTDF